MGTKANKNSKTVICTLSFYFNGELYPEKDISALSETEKEEELTDLYDCADLGKMEQPEYMLDTGAGCVSVNGFCSVNIELSDFNDKETRKQVADRAWEELQGQNVFGDLQNCKLEGYTWTRVRDKVQTQDKER